MASWIRLMWQRSPSAIRIVLTRLLTVEDTANRGAVHRTRSRPSMRSHRRRTAAGATHLDGARLFNAVVATGTEAARRVRDYDTVSVCLSKGLGAPVGSILAGPADLMDRALWIRKALGGGMRQAGVIAAAGLYALEHHVDRLADDHARATTLGAALSALGYPSKTPRSNMLYVTVSDGPKAQALLDGEGVRCLSVCDGAASRDAPMLTMTGSPATAAFETPTALRPVG